MTCTRSHELIFACFGCSWLAPSVPVSTEHSTFCPLSPLMGTDLHIGKLSFLCLVESFLVVSVGTVCLTPHVVAQGLPRLYEVSHVLGCMGEYYKVKGRDNLIDGHRRACAPRDFSLEKKDALT